jgi:hypothetical protein
LTEELHRDILALKSQLDQLMVSEAYHPRTLVRRTTAQLLLNGVETFLGFEEAVTDADEMWSLGNPQALICQTPGWYWTWGSVQMGTTGAGTRTLTIVKVAYIGGVATEVASVTLPPPTGKPFRGQVSGPVYLTCSDSGADKIKFKVLQDSGLDLNAQVSSFSPQFGAFYWG